MSLSSANHSIQLITRLLDAENATEPIVDFGPQKPEISSGRSAQPLPPCIPEQQGVPSRHIARFLRALAEEPTLRTHSVLVVRNGHILARAAFGMRDTETPRMTFSACKSITALAIGLLMDDGLLHADDRLTDLFPEECGPVSRRLMKDLTVAHVLSMQTGNLFNEAGSMTQAEWVRSYFLSPALDTSRKFQYNSLNSYILAALIQRLTGKSLSGFLSERLFTPMGIGDFYWEKSPEGVEKGGWGLYMKPEDLAKLGQLVMDLGCWNGKQLISAAFLERALQTHALTPEEYGDFNYGWQIWVGRTENTFLFSGMLGQNVLGFRDSGIVLVAHAGNDETFQTSAFYRIASRYFGGHFPGSLPRDVPGERELRHVTATISDCTGKIPTREEFARFYDKRFITSEPQAASAGLLPVVLQAVENSYSAGLQAITIGGTRANPEILYEERDQLHHLVCGTKVPVRQKIHWHGNTFLAAVQARFTHDEDENPVLRVQIDFLETPCTRVLKLVLTRRGLVVKQEEFPGEDFLANTMSMLLSAPGSKALLTALAGSAEQGFLRWKIQRVLSPVLRFTEET